ncbi:MAG TPA: hypothetical protein VGL89_02915 [Candidatus Koribacter sp.]|jgi:hypothetical protein
MPHLGFDVAHETRFQENRRLGSWLLMTGWVLWGMCAIGGMFVFQDIREGTHMWLVYDGVFGFIGLVLVAAGTIFRRRVPKY